MNFISPIHFGNASHGGALDSIELSYGSDQLTSALCHEFLPNEQALQAFINKLKLNQIKISSLFPYLNDEYYLPKPIFIKEHSSSLLNLNEFKKEKKAAKQLKKKKYIRSSILSEGLTAVIKDTSFNPKFVTENISTRVNMREEDNMPYQVASYIFTRGAGLYTLVGVESEDNFNLISKAFTHLGYSGIGGKRSSGYGKFKLNIISLDDKIALKDLKAIYKLLSANGSYKMTISSTVPIKSNWNFKAGFYSLKKKSGFISGSNITAKRNGYYSIAEGSVFPFSLTGQMLEIKESQFSHTIYRNGLSFELGVSE